LLTKTDPQVANRRGFPPFTAAAGSFMLAGLMQQAVDDEPKQDDQKQDQEQQQEEQEVHERSAPSGKIVHKAIVKEGEEELERPSSALFWSGLASKLGYSVGFLVVILGRQQLFTENTLTPILPLMLHKTAKTFGNVARLWLVVLLANLIGALIVGWACVRSGAFDEPVKATFIEIGHQAMQHDFGTTLVRGIFAGWLIALMVWLLPFAETARVWVIIIITYLVGVGHFSHIIAGAVETFAVAWAHQKSWPGVLGGFIVPTLIGNILGGVTLVAALNHAQVVAGDEGEDV